jgi:transposase-like protein
MAKKTEIRQQRLYSEELKRHIVDLIVKGEFTIAQAMREFDIGGKQTLYNWLYRYSRNLRKGVRLVMEKDSIDKTNEELRKEVLRLEAALGRMSLEAALYKTILEKAHKETGIDFKKNFGEEQPKR